MITNNMRLSAMLQQLREGVPVLLFDLTAKDESKRLPKRLFPDAQTALNTLEAEGIEGSVITWEFMPLVLRYEIVWVPVVQ